MDLKKLLEELYPKCFQPNDKITSPLKIDIHKDLKQLREKYPDVISGVSIKDFLQFYTASKKYNDGLKQPGAMRIDLNGKAIEPVSNKDLEYANTRFKKVKKKPKPTLKTSSKKTPQSTLATALTKALTE